MASIKKSDFIKLSDLIEVAPSGKVSLVTVASFESEDGQTHEYPLGDREFFNQENYSEQVDAVVASIIENALDAIERPDGTTKQEQDLEAFEKFKAVCEYCCIKY